MIPMDKGGQDNPNNIKKIIATTRWTKPKWHTNIRKRTSKLE